MLACSMWALTSYRHMTGVAATAGRGPARRRNGAAPRGQPGHDGAPRGALAPSPGARPLIAAPSQTARPGAGPGARGQTAARASSQSAGRGAIPADPASRTRPAPAARRAARAPSVDGGSSRARQRCPAACAGPRPADRCAFRAQCRRAPRRRGVPGPLLGAGDPAEGLAGGRVELAASATRRRPRPRGDSLVARPSRSRPGAVRARARPRARCPASPVASASAGGGPPSWPVWRREQRGGRPGPRRRPSGIEPPRPGCLPAPAVAARRSEPVARAARPWCPGPSGRRRRRRPGGRSRAARA